MRKLLILLSCLALALGSFALAGCGDDDDNAADETAPQTQPQQEQGGDNDATDEESAGGAKVSVIDNDYDPKEVSIKTGETVTWTWDGQVPHTVTDRDKKFDSGIKDPGSTFKQKFDEAGVFNYFCSLHPGQEGKITVK